MILRSATPAEYNLSITFSNSLGLGLLRTITLTILSLYGLESRRDAGSSL